MFTKLTDKERNCFDNLFDCRLSDIKKRDAAGYAGHVSSLALFCSTQESQYDKRDLSTRA